MAGKFNPFRPDKMVPPGLFAGRLEEIEYTESCMLQTKHENPKHFMFVGERGIGKSSLILFDQYLGEGLVEAKGGHKYNFIVLNVSLRREDDFLAIIDRIANALKKQIEKHDVFGTFVLKTIEILTRFEAAGVRYNHQVTTKNEAFLSLQDDLENAFIKMADAFDGILLLIDEADAPDSSADLGLICKLLTEEMSKRQTDRLCIGLAGLPTLPIKLRESHESSLRLFQIMNLETLESGEREMVIQMGLNSANKKNEAPIGITPEAEILISTYSEGYPHFLQEFAFCAFEEDSDNMIDKDDFFKSLFRENGAFDQLGAKYFDRDYATPGSDDYREVLKCMSDGYDGWITRGDIIVKTELKASTVDNALRALKKQGLIIQDDRRSGHYRLPTRSFAAWINIKKKAEFA
ncbi:ATP-binding protein [Maritalea sp. S77]|uniref:ATP-binding protein n=1 Tax=Maritalea sp. S77 TaxID=3415125 RepID=UPI003C7E026D